MANASDSSSISLTVKVWYDEVQNVVKSDHAPTTGADEVVMKSWPSGGLVQVAHAMFVEALRREAYTMAISLLSQGTLEDDLTPKAIEDVVRAHILEMMDKFAEGAAQEALSRIQS